MTVPPAKPKVAKAAPRFSRELPEARRTHLVEAATRCLAKGGIGGLTTDRICKEANVSRGLINHYFASRDDLLIEIYRASLYDTVNAMVEELRRRAEGGDLGPEQILAELVKSNFSEHYFNRENLLVWLSLWGEIAKNERLRATHRELYDGYRAELSRQMEAVAAARSLDIDSPALARSFIALVDGLWLIWCLDPDVITREGAEASSFAFLEARLGPLQR